MADPMVVDQKDVDLGLKKSQNKSMKRKRLEILGLLEEKEANIDKLNEEMNSLFGFYSELMKDGVLSVEDLLKNGGVSLDLAIGVVIEESSLTLSKLVEVVFEKLKGKFGSNGGFSLGCVKSKVILIGQRCCYGLFNVDADVLQDDSESALWCWETRDLKLMPKSTRNLLKIRRTCRKMIHERIMALSSMIDILKKSQIHEHCPSDLVKASEKLARMLSEEDIRKLMESMAQKNNNEMADKEAKHGEKLLLKQLEKNKREAEKEKKRVARELKKEKLQSEKDQKRLQDEAEKEARRREKEESEKRKQLKRQQEELEKDHHRKERGKTELKMQSSLQKQAYLMERFLQKAKPASTSLGDQSLKKATSTTNGDAQMHESVTQSMDNILSLNGQFDSENLWRSHLNSWRSLHHSKKSHWSIRQKPKRELVKELKLSTNSVTCHDGELNMEHVGEGWVDQSIESSFDHVNMEVSPSSQKAKFHKQLLQFDKANRPPFYGFWPKKSEVVKGRRPFVQDSDLDYEIDSDEEWEEEEPGEDLSDDDDDDETLEEGCSRGEDEEESEDGFFVPDGYLSEDEGVEVEKMDLDELAECKNSPAISATPQLEDPALPLRQQKYLFNVTEHALRRNQPLVISNLTHEKASLLLVEDLTGADKIEKMCLEALSMCAFPDSHPIEILACSDLMEENEKAQCSTQSKTNLSPVTTETAISESDIPQMIAVVQSNSQGKSRIIEALQHKFPSASKTQLRNKVREIADFCDNRWQVKKDVLVKFGLPISPETGRGKNRSIATFFSKRCQPPGKHFDPNETSPPSAKLGAVSQPQRCSTSTEHV